MATPAPAWNLVRVFGTWNRLDGTRQSGTYKITIPQRVVDITDDVIIPAGVFTTGSLVTTTGAISMDVMVPAVDDADINPRNFSILVEITFTPPPGGTPAAPELFNIRPTIAGGAIDLARIAPGGGGTIADPVDIDPVLSDTEVLANAAVYTDDAITAHEAATNPHPVYARLVNSAGNPSGGRVIVAGAGEAFPPVEPGSILIFGGA